MHTHKKRKIFNTHHTFILFGDSKRTFDACAVVMVWGDDGIHIWYVVLLYHTNNTVFFLQESCVKHFFSSSYLYIKRKCLSKSTRSAQAPNFKHSSCVYVCGASMIPNPTVTHTHTYDTIPPP